MATIFIGLGLIVVGIIGFSGGIENLGAWWSLGIIVFGLIVLRLSMNETRL